jgi:hypothetical protein
MPSLMPSLMFYVDWLFLRCTLKRMWLY